MTLVGGDNETTQLGADSAMLARFHSPVGSVDERPATLRAPQKIVTCRADPFPRSTSVKHYQIYAWEVSCSPKKERFWPKKSFHNQDIEKQAKPVGSQESSDLTPSP